MVCDGACDARAIAAVVLTRRISPPDVERHVSEDAVFVLSLRRKIRGVLGAFTAISALTAPRGLGPFAPGPLSSRDER